jgi:hypothetical protein
MVVPTDRRSAAQMVAHSAGLRVPGTVALLVDLTAVMLVVCSDACLAVVSAESMVVP